MTESQVTAKLVRQLNNHGYFWKASDKFRAGIPDVIGVCGGRFAAIEVKIDSNGPTPLQVHTLDQMERHMAYTAVATYSNKHKLWFVNGQSFPSTETCAAHIIRQIEDRTI